MKDLKTTILGLIPIALAIFVGVGIFDEDTSNMLNEVAVTVVGIVVGVIAFIAKDKKSADDWKQFLAGLLVAIVAILIAVGVAPELINQIDEVGWLIIAFISVALGGTAELPERFKSKTTP